MDVVSSSDDDEPSSLKDALIRASRKTIRNTQPASVNQADPRSLKPIHHSKVPRMMFPNVVSFTAFHSELDALVGDSYTIKALNSGDCAVQCNTADTYRQMARHFLKKGS